MTVSLAFVYHEHRLMDYLIFLFRPRLPDGARAFGDEEQDTSSPAAIVAHCEMFMKKNLVTGSAHGMEYSFNRPSSYKYSLSQWLWGETALRVSRYPPY